MRHSSLSSFLKGERPPDELWREIEPEVPECRAACRKGGSGHVILTSGPDTLVEREQGGAFLTALAETKLPLEAASYIADALIMSDNFSWEDAAVGEVLFRLSDESAPITLADVEEARLDLSSAP